jgi:hypothetical protein
MPYIRDDRYVTDALGRALAGADVYYCTQPATAPSAAPPSPLATTYGTSAGPAITQPIVTDGFGHAFTYLDPSITYTVVIYHELFGENPVVLTDQTIAGGTGSGLTAFEGILLGTQDGVNKIFTLSNAGVALVVAPVQATVWDNFGMIPNVGYTISGVTVTFTTAPATTDSLYGRGFIAG